MTHKEYKSIQKLLEFGRCHLLFGTEHALDLVEEALHNILVIEEDIRVEHETETFIDEHNLVFGKVAYLSFQVILAWVVGWKDFIKNEGEDILVALTLSKKESSPLVLYIE